MQEENRSNSESNMKTLRFYRQFVSARALFTRRQSPIYEGRLGFKERQQNNLGWMCFNFRHESSFIDSTSTFSKPSSSQRSKLEGTESLQIELDEQVNNAVKEEKAEAIMKLMRKAKSQGVIPLAKTYAAAMHSCVLHERHNDMDLIYKDMELNYEHVGEGVRTTLIRSYSARKMWNSAINILDAKKDHIQNMRHTRSFNPVITGLAENGHVAEAFELFGRKVQMQCHSKKDVGLIPDVDMLVTLINACCKGGFPDEYKENPFIQEKPKNFEVNARETALKNTGARTSNQDNIKMHHLVYKVLEFFHNSGNKVPAEVLDALKVWLQCDPQNHWHWNSCRISNSGVCQKCGVHLKRDLPHGYFKELETGIVSALMDPENIKPNGKLRFSRRGHTEFKEFQENLRSDKTQFDVIIDGQNVAYEHARRKDHSHRFNSKRIKKVVAHFTAQRKRVLLVMHNHSLEKDVSKDFINSLQKSCTVYVTKTNMNDDLFLLYAMAANGREDTCVITGDRWRDHRLLLAHHLHWKFLKWVRLNHISFHETKNGGIIFNKNKFDPVVQKSEKAWHFPGIEGGWYCAAL